MPFYSDSNTNNVGNISDQNNLNHSSTQKKMAQQFGVYITNNDNCTINITFK